MIRHHDTIPNAGPGWPGAIPQQVLQASPGLRLHQSVGMIRIKSRLTSLVIVKPGPFYREPSLCLP